VSRFQKRALLAIAALAAIAGIAFTAASFLASSTNASNSVGAAPDYVAPTVSATTISRTASGAPTGTAGNIKQGDTYRVYANVSDSGNPASGINAVTADVSTVSGGGATAVALTACSTNCVVNGTTYGFVSADQAATNPQADGAKAYTIHTADNASNAKTTSGFTVNVDSTAPVIAASTLASTTSGVPVSSGGFVKASGTYKVYANITEPTSGVASASASVTNFGGSSTLALTACSSNCTVGGVTYGWVSAEQTAGSALTSGSKNYTVSATDNSTNAGGPTTFSATVDNTAPTSLAATIVGTTSGTPTGKAGFVKQGGTYRVYANATDASAGINKVTANVTNVTTNATAVAMTACTSSCTQGGTTYTYVSSEQTANNPLTSGSKTYTITAGDNANNSATSGTINVTVDNTAPTISASTISPTSSGTPTGGPGVVKAGGTYRVYANVTDSSSGVATVAADVSNVTSGDSSLALTTCASNCTVGGTTYGFVSAEQTANALLVDGSQGYSVSATDGAANSATNSTFSVNVDNTAPTISGEAISPVASGNPTGTPGFVKQGGSYKVYANATDANGVNSVSAGIGNISTATTATLTACSGTCTVGGVTYAYSTATQTAKNPLSEGSKSYSVTATDNATNSATDSTPTVTVDDTAPTISASTISPTSSGNPTGAPGFVKQGGTFRVYANASDSSSGISTVSADLTNVTGSSSVALTTCSSNCTIGGTTYSYVSAQQTASGSLSSGSKTYTISATDGAVNTGGPTSFNVTVDNTAPSISASAISPTSSGTPSGPAGFVKQGTTYRVYANVTDASAGVNTVTASVNNVTTGATSISLTACSSNCTVGGTTYGFVSAEQTANNPLTDGSKSYSITASDNATNSTTNSGFSVTADSTAPTISASAISPTSSGTPTGTPGFVKQGGSYKVYANISDGSGSGVASASADVSNATTGATSVALTTCSTNCTVGGVTYGFVSAEQTANNPLSEGSKGYSVSATDNLGSARTTSTFSVTVDNTAPTVSASAISPTSAGTPTGAPGFVKQGGTYKVFANVSDSGSGVGSASADVSNVSAGDTSVALTTCSTNCTVGGTTYGFVSAEQTADNPLTEGSKSYSVTAADSLGNSATNSTFSVTLDNTGPSTTMTDPGSPLSGASVSLSATASDSGGSGVQSVLIERKLSSQSTWTTVCTDTTSPYGCTLDTTALADGSYDFRATSTDNAGNSTTSTAVTQRLVSNKTPTGTNFVTANGGATQGIIETGDSATYTFSEEMSTTSILSTWTNASTPQNVSVKFFDGSTDTMQIFNGATEMPLGTVDLKDDYVPTGGATFAATMVGAVQADGTFNVTVTLGSKTAGNVQSVVPKQSKPTWTPSPPTGATDLTGTAMSATAFTSTINVRQF
jgi:Bacterial Ig domain